MYDINFFQKSFSLKKNITFGELSINEFAAIEKELEELRDKEPTIFNIETTKALYELKYEIFHLEK